jgi:cobalt-zinc-cadmium resistance protein CzcA
MSAISPSNFSVRGRDLESTVKEAQLVLRQHVSLPEGYRVEWHGEYDQLQDEKARLTQIVPLTLLLILLLVYFALSSMRDAILVLFAVPFALAAGSLRWRSPARISAFQPRWIYFFVRVAIQGGLILVSRIRDLINEGNDLRAAIIKGAEVRMRPVLMTSLAAAIGLLPAAIATGIGAQSQQPLARVVVGGMLTSPILILLVLPVLFQVISRRYESNQETEKTVS